MTSICDLTATALSRAIAKDELSSREVVEAHLERIAHQDVQLAAFVTVDADGARRGAQICDAAPAPIGPLHGVPVGIKDLTDTAGLATTCGSVLFRDHVPAEDDLVVARLRRAGAIILGKTNTPEFGFGAVCTNKLCGPTRNPFNPALTSGGSSGGSAVAVATGMVPLAHGTDFGGSVRTPASFCDVASIRPTPGRIPSHRRPLGWDMLATHGFLARGVDDLELALSVFAGGDVHDPLSMGVVNDERPVAIRPRIAVTTDFGVAPVARDVRARFAAACAALAVVADVVPSAPHCGGAIETFRTLRGAHIANSYGELLKARRAELTPTVIWNIEAGAKLSAEDYLNAERRRTGIYRSFRELFSHTDFLVAPAASVLPWPNEISDVTAIDGAALETPIDYLAVTFIVSLVGFPVLTLPAPRAENELPFGIQITAPPGCESRLFAFGRVIENELGFSHRWPKLP
ncbi:amidase [Bradyrhizobium sp. WSM471]|uniref:amidase n=1 Tax=Bradyrhizobium sp. WSM471 TaxID=319017 RepID=UPI00024D2214|nr:MULTISPECIES: amidase [Bradyrhizobium]EHR02507.1 amidase, Asp-tRNAAsn/Glu-tRNAGln amidotransferase A subunit [Bradyrhizobium sp. WSM471]UFW44503.1 amidase [Bradyrhizobium canariense]